MGFRSCMSGDGGKSHYTFHNPINQITPLYPFSYIVPTGARLSVICFPATLCGTGTESADWLAIFLSLYVPSIYLAWASSHHCGLSGVTPL